MCNLVQSNLELTDPDLAELPAGSLVDVLPFPAEYLTFGDVVYGRNDERPFVGRFLRHQGDELELSQRGRCTRVRSAQTVGRVIRALVSGREFDPREQGAVKKLYNRLTCFGTVFKARAAQ